MLRIEIWVRVRVKDRIMDRVKVFFLIIRDYIIVRIGDFPRVYIRVWVTIVVTFCIMVLF